MNYEEIVIPKKYSLMVDSVEFVLDLKYEYIGICMVIIFKYY